MAGAGVAGAAGAVASGVAGAVVAGAGAVVAGAVAAGGAAGVPSLDGGSRSPAGRPDGAGAFAAGCSPPIWSITEAVEAEREAKMVMLIEVTMNIAASIQVTLPRAVAAARPEIAPPDEPMPSPPPSDRCSSTTPINSKARMRWTVRITFSMRAGLSKRSRPI